jgi:hypothetical protein
VRTLVLVSRDPDWALGLASAWAQHGAVTAVLCDHAAVRARAGHPNAADLVAAAEAGVVLLVHDEALAARGIQAEALVPAVKPVDIDEIADLVADGADKAVWL